VKKALALTVALGLTLSGCGGGTGGSSGGEQPKATDSQGNKAASGKQVDLQFYFPVAVGGPITKIIDKLVADFQAENPDIKVTAIYGGSYQDTMTKVTTAVKSNNAPDMAVLLSTDLYTLLSMNALDDLTTKFPKEYLGDFYPAFMANSKVGDTVWSIPFQRSTIVLYYNKEAFKKAGLDPEKGPKNWDEMREFSKKVKDSGAAPWGIEIPSTGYAYWMFQALALQTTGKNIMSGDGKSVSFDTPENVSALQYWLDLVKKDKVMPEGVIEWATVPSDFISGKTAMMFHTTGNLTKVKTDAKFDFGVSFLPANKQFGSPTGGGNLYVFKNISEERKQAAYKFVQFLTTPERVAQWSIDTGYVATRKTAYNTDALKKYVADFPQAAVARDQLEYADSELSTYQNGQVQKIVNDNIQAALSGTMTAQEALQKSQQQATDVLKNFK